MKEYQTTIKGLSDKIHGIDLFSGKDCYVRFHSAKPNTGIVFLVNGNYENEVKANLANAENERNKRISSISLHNREKGIKVKLVEHILCAVYVAGIDNLIIELSGDVCPTTDDITLTHYNLLKHRLFVQDEPRQFFECNLEKEVTIYHQNKRKRDKLIITPTFDKNLTVSYMADREELAILNQRFDFEFGKTDFASKVARARTFAWPPTKSVYHIIQALGKLKIHGARDSNCVFVTPFSPDYVNSTESESRYENNSEFARHKTIDVIGTFPLLEHRVRGAHFKFDRTGHAFDLYAVDKAIRECFVKSK